MSEKPRDAQYYIAPTQCSFGLMICGACKKPIDSKKHDFRVYRGTCKEEGWRYVTHHRSCLPGDIQFDLIENRRREDARQSKLFWKDVAALKIKYAERPHLVGLLERMEEEEVRHERG